MLGFGNPPQQTALWLPPAFRSHDYCLCEREMARSSVMSRKYLKGLGAHLPVEYKSKSCVISPRCTRLAQRQVHKLFKRHDTRMDLP